MAIIGGGQTGVSAAVGFLNAGFELTLFSERDQPSLRDGGPATGTAVTFAVAQAAERELSLDDYASRAPRVTGQSTQIFSSSGADRKDGLDFDVTYGGIRAVGVDTRLKVMTGSTNSSPGEAVSSSRQSPVRLRAPPPAASWSKTLRIRARLV